MSDGVHSFALHHYGQIDWTAGGASGADEDTGLGGTAAQVQYVAVQLLITLWLLIIVILLVTCFVHNDIVSKDVKNFNTNLKARIMIITIVLL